MIFNESGSRKKVYANVDMYTQSGGMHPHGGHSSKREKYVLLVEDEELATYMATSILKQLGCQVDCASDGKQALELAKKNQYSLILMDLGLSNIDGLEVTKQIRLHESGVTKAFPVPIVALTANEDPIKKLNCLEAGFNNVLKKPLTKENAQNILDAFIKDKKVIDRELENTSSHFTSVSGKVIDVSKLVDLIECSSEHAHIRSLIDKLIDDFPNEVNQLKQAHKKNDWREISDITLRIAGKSAYCSMERLKAACTQLIDYLGLGYHELAESMYSTVLNEIELVLQKYAELKEAGIL